VYRKPTCWLLGLPFCHKNRGSKFLWYVSELLQDYTAAHPKRQTCLGPYKFSLILPSLWTIVTFIKIYLISNYPRNYRPIILHITCETMQQLHAEVPIYHNMHTPWHKIYKPILKSNLC
jgi:hypothetical protein